MAKNALRLLVAFYVSGIAYMAFVEDKIFRWDFITEILLLKRYPGWSEFLASFAAMMAVGILRASGFLEFFGGLLGKLTEPFGLPAPVVPVIIVKLFSSSAATGLVLDIFKNYGTDSRIGMMTSILLSCTETCFYTMSVYYMAARVTKTRYTLTGALLATAAGVAASVLLTGLFTPAG